MEAALLEWRNTPRADGYSPAQAFFGRRLRTKLPSLTTNEFEPQLFSAARAATRNEARRRRDQKARALEDLHPGDQVVAHDLHSGRGTHLGEVKEAYPDGRSYEVELDDGSSLRRNRRFLRHAASSDENIKIEDEDGQPTPIRRSPRLLAQAGGADRS